MTLDAKQPSHILNDSKVLSELDNIHNDLINKSKLSQTKKPYGKRVHKTNRTNLIQTLLNNDNSILGNLEMMELFKNGLINTQSYKDDSDLLISMNEHLLKSCKQLKLENEKLTDQLAKVGNDHNDNNNCDSTEIDSLKKQLIELKQQLDSPSLLYLIKMAKLQNQTILSDKDYNDMYSLTENPPLKFLTKKAKLLNQLVVPISECEALEEKIESPSLVYLIQKAKLQGYTVISDADYNDLQSLSVEPSLQSLKEKAMSNYSQTLISKKTFEEMTTNIESPSLLYLIQKAKIQKYTIISDEDYDTMYSTLKQPSFEFLTQRANEMGQVVIPKSDFDTLGGSIESPSLLYLLQKAKLQKQTIISDKDYKALMETCNSPSMLHLIEKSKEQGYVVISEKDYLPMHETVESPSMEFLTTKADALGKTLISKDVYQEMKSDIDSPSLLYLIQKAKEQQYTIISDDDYNKMYSTNESPSLSYIKEKATSLGQVVTPSDEYETMQDTVAHPSLTFLSSMALLKGCQVIENDSYNQLKEDAFAKDAVQKLQDELEGLQNQLAYPSIERLEKIAKDNGYKLSALETQDKTDATPTVTTDISEEELAQQADKLDFVAISKETFAQMNEQLKNPTLSKDQIIEQAKQNNIEIQDLIVQHKGVSNVMYDEDYDITQENITDDVTNLRSSAKNYGMLCVPETSFVATSSDITPDEDNVVLLPKSYYSSLLQNSKPDLNGVNDELLLKEVKIRGLQKPIIDNFTVFSSPNNSQSDEGQSTTPSSKNYTTHVSTKVNVGTSGRNSINAMPSNNSGRRSLSISNINLKTPRRGKGVRHSASVDGAVSLAAMASVGDSNNIVSAISQTVIGEFVYKYFNRLGSFGGGETRHKRYMWIHPYSLTLYWSDSNPVVDDPWNRKTKGVSILRVESVDDNTTGPAKLYNKSIVVTTREKKIKFTCVDKQRHDVWYNALKYLIQRNMEGINLQDVFGNPSDELYSGNILSLPYDVHHNTNKSMMHSSFIGSRRSSRRSSLSKFLR
ncbi:similar to Saccharomyces cerevisiae YDR150W NUM1 Protein required for nuclear migration, localizes to the mother cell cortex and the bud tip [Maudiozyma saulgeensis]|uniref:Similar to Saccharomyces cerevisiae YDR150W NUM1 Protein required for nuclear migration, localizes to the mother cell cortex and the bud tip n=1 Tax=Maudiozyma saulgeensis TaxID=1789683 RepID=A0A1X7R679_9SACH|nr:similar to Saccharomyces cerevisiae YDR150W NUM1 Protein required for nuclear migration, localizes to the mother cell cortex and the bud tip [Kazachstania saulgeensis]